MERQIPKNVRQIGNVSNTPKIYVEDYVDTFFTQLCEKAGETPVGAFLIGDMQQTDNEEYVYIYGAVQMHELKVDESGYVLDEDTWKTAYEDCKQYFEDGEMLGWFVARSGTELRPDNSALRLHKKSFPKKNTVFIMKDPVEKEENYYVYKFNDLMEISGHYTYYEKNPCMQNYMVSCRKKNGVSPSETVEDRAAKDFRSVVHAREAQKKQAKASRMMYAVSACLVLIVVVMGAAMINNYDKMKSVQSRLDNLSGTSEAAESEEVLETSGNVTAVTGDAALEGDGQAEGPAAEGQAPEGNSQAAEGQTADGQALDAQSADMQSADAAAAAETAAAEQTAQGDSSDTDTVIDNSNAQEIGIYVVEEGDTLAIISRKMYGDISYVDAICRMNGLTDGNLIYVGQKLLLP